jgi:hypothetical protein
MDNGIQSCCGINAFWASAEVEQHQKTKGDETAQDDSIPSPLSANSGNQPIDARYLCCRTRDPSIYTGQSLPLYAEVLVDGIRLSQHPINHTVTLV